MVNQPDWNVPVDYQDDMGNSLLHIVCQNGNRRLVKLCMRRGADLNIRNLNGQTPLHFAFGYGYTELGEYLVQKGADDSICNKDGLTPYEGLGERELSLL
jgi:ankyrin repeat protein